MDALYREVLYKAPARVGQLETGEERPPEALVF